MKTKEIKIATLTLESPRFLYIKYKQLEDYPGKDEVMELVKSVVELAGENEIVIMSDFRDLYMDWEEEGKNYLASSDEVNQVRKATALLVNNLPTRILIRAFLKMKKPKGNFEVFTEENEARKWLNEQL